MEAPPDKFDFPATETETLEQWKAADTFKRSLELSEGRKLFSFYDGPPFATGLPHYGHILAGTIKDIVTRYAHQTGHHVERRFGWDCHGLPVEFEIDQKLGIKGRDDVMAMGIPAYNKECRSIVSRYCKEWETVVTRLGRWIDFKNDYKTMEPWYMESVWWVFQTMFKKGLVYRGFKVMPFSTACNTPLSNFEANLNYKDAKDPAVIVSFPLVDEPETSLLAWTTTPWTLPSNLGLCVHPTLLYIKIKDVASGSVYIVGESRLVSLYPKSVKKGYKGGEFEKLGAPFAGSTLKGKRYTPLFDYFSPDGPHATESAAQYWQVMNDTYVTDDSGTGIVHQAPAFGEDDYRVCMAAGLVAKGEQPPCPIDVNGRFTDVVPEWKGQHVKDADDGICAALKAKGRLVSKGSIIHSYPFCWRSDTPLIYRTIPSWFVNVEAVKEKLIANNMQTHWVPAFVQEKRFHNWLADARDWAISRSRYWGTPLPLWVSADFEEVVCIGSIEELFEKSGERVTDLHRESIDHITIPSARPGQPPLTRVDEVFDCWFESGSMPYAQQHYPFENKDKFEKSFPADFIAEGLDQTRGWFYTLMVISTALFDKPAFKNLIVNGLVLASDGKKMSKRLKNYPDPTLVVDKYGADALRLYLIDSPVVRAEPLRFTEDGVLDVVKTVFLPWFNAFRFFAQNARRLPDWKPDFGAAKASANTMDTWILASLQGLIKFVHAEMNPGYRLYTVVPRLLDFIRDLTNWYVRLNRKRLKGDADAGGEAEARVALSCLYEVLLTMSLIMAPFTPFFAEHLYQKLRAVHPARDDAAAAEDAVGRSASVHFVMLPAFDASRLDEAKEAQMRHLQAVVELGRKVRERRNISLKIPVRSVTVVCPTPATLDAIRGVEAYVLSELNARELHLTTDEETWCTLSAVPNNKTLGKRLGKALKDVKKHIAQLGHAEVTAFMRSGTITIGGHELTAAAGDLEVHRAFKGDKDAYEADTTPDGTCMAVVDVRPDAELLAAGTVRELVNRVQKLRKSSGLAVEDKVHVYFEEAEEEKEEKEEKEEEEKQGSSVVEGKAPAVANITAALKLPGSLAIARAALGGGSVTPMPARLCPAHAVELGREVCDMGAGNAPLTVVLVRPCLSFKAGVDGTPASIFASSLAYAGAAAAPSLAAVIDGKEVALANGVDYFPDALAALRAGAIGAGADDAWLLAE